MNEIILELVNKCDLGNISGLPKKIEGGLLNKMFKVSTTKGNYAFKLINPEVAKRKDGIKNLIFTEKVSNIAKLNGIKCISAIEINNELIHSINGKYFLIFDWFDGRPINESELTEDKIKTVAKELCKLHKIEYNNLKNECDITYELDEINFDFYLSKIKDKNIYNLVKEIKNRFSNLDKESIESLKKIKDKKVISHRDLDLPNVLWNSENIPVIIDWETSGWVNPTLEVIDTAWNWAGGKDFFDKNKYSIFVNTYEKEGGNLDDYEIAFKADYKAKLRWFEYNLKRITIFDFLDEEEKKLGEKEVLRSADEIIKFDDYKNDMLNYNKNI
jgi:Ser/Thr protein kinase RdoA (MazF antagonist)